MLTERIHYYKALERDARRPLGEAAHPDDCPKLLLHGVGFAVPARGVRILPRFGPEGVRLLECGGPEWPEAAQLRQVVAALHRQRRCPSCGRPVGATLEIDLSRSGRALELAFAVAVRALRAQYDLSDEQLADLLAISGDSVPPWLVQIVRYCHDLPTQGSPQAPAAESGGDRKQGFVRRLLGR